MAEEWHRYVLHSFSFVFYFCILFFLLDQNYTITLPDKSWKGHLTKQQLYGHLPPITTIQIRRTRHCWRSKDELISDVLLWTSTYGYASIGRPKRIYLHQLCAGTGCCLEDLPDAMDDRNDGERERERGREGERESGKSLLSVQLYDDDNETGCYTKALLSLSIPRSREKK